MIKYFIVVIVILIFIIGSYRYGQNVSQMEMLHGFWEANSEFNKEAGLQMFTFYIGKKCDNKYQAYLLMVESGDDQNLLMNEPVSFKLLESYMDIISNSDCREMILKFSDLETTLIPNILTMRFYPKTSKIVLSDNKKIYAVFFKNPVLSEMEHIMSEKNKKNIHNNNSQININKKIINSDKEDKEYADDKEYEEDKEYADDKEDKDDIA